jgi:CRISPR-associated protein Cmr2
MQSQLPIQDIPASITLHATISRALMTFSVNVVELIEKYHKGFVLYAGGDDVICILPAENALNAAFEIRTMYRGNEKIEGFYNRIGKTASLLSMGGLGQSFSLVYSHYKYPLSYVIDKLNNEEEQAKEKKWNSISKNNIAISYLARGSHDATVYLPLQRQGLGLGSVCKEIDDILREIDEGKYSESIVTDFLNWKEKISYFDSDDIDNIALQQLLKYIISRNTSNYHSQ